jgi:hypothetical protein
MLGATSPVRIACDTKKAATNCGRFFAGIRISVQTAERVNQDKNGKRDTDQPQQQITSHENASGVELRLNSHGKVLFRT